MSLSRMLQPVLKSEDFLSLAARIRNDFPYSISVHNMLLMKARGYNDCFKPDFYVLSGYPDSHVVIWNIEGREIGLHCLPEETPLLLQAIQESQLLSFDEEKILIRHIPDYLLGPLSETIRPQCIGSVFQLPHYTFVYQDNQNYPLKCPAGMRLRRLGRAALQHLLHMTKFNKEDNVEHMATFTKNTPALGLYLDPSVDHETLIDLATIDSADPEAMPIASISSRAYGSLGRLRTAEEYRRKGLATLLTQLAVRLQMEDGYIPHVHVVEGNSASTTLFRKLPGWKEAQATTWFYHFKDKNRLSVFE